MDYKKAFVQFFTSAAQDRPERESVRIIDGCWTLTIKGNQGAWAEMVQAACVPESAEQIINGDTLTVQWPSIGDRIFAAGGLMDKNLPDYEMRAPQLHMARLVQRAIEMGEPAIIEAGTGTGKSFAYAAVAMAMGKRCIISTSNKALQAQLYQKDIPFLCKLFPGKKVALAQGKSNYLCRAKCQEATDEVEALAAEVDEISRQIYGRRKNGDDCTGLEADLDEKRYALDAAIKAAPSQIPDYALAEWCKVTDTGNVEELSFPINGVHDWTVDEECTGRKCPFYFSCFYYQEKAKRQNADVIICNHALLILNELYPMANILPGAGVVIVDEAHKLADYARGALGQEFTMNSIDKMLGKLVEDLDAETADAERYFQQFWNEVSAFTAGAKDRQVAVKRDHEFEQGMALVTELRRLADLVWNTKDMPVTPSEIKQSKRADKARNLADKIAFMCGPTQDKHVRWIEPEKDTLFNVPFDVSEFIGKMAGFEKSEEITVQRTHCARCNHALTADAVHVLNGVPYGPDCIRYVDHFGDAEIIPREEWGDSVTIEPVTIHEPTPIIFTSATMAVETGDSKKSPLNHFMRECGIDHGFQMVAGSPFDYQSNALLYIPNGDTPDPKSDKWQSYMVNDVRQLVLSAKGGAFVLFTSYSNMKYAVNLLRSSLENAGLTVYMQGELSKGEIAKRFREDGNAVLFATKSFWEGISIEGAALRLVIIDKMPFSAPSPMIKAREAAFKNPFFDMAVPEMVIDLKQGAGRLIRRMDDYGVIALLDSRARLTGYGRKRVIPSMPPAKLTHSTAEVSEFFFARANQVTKSMVDGINIPITVDQDFLDELEELGF